VLGCFCEAFHLPLVKMLPLREWWETRDDRIAVSLIALIQNAKGTGE